ACPDGELAAPAAERRLGLARLHLGQCELAECRLTLLRLRPRRPSLLPRRDVVRHALIMRSGVGAHVPDSEQSAAGAIMPGMARKLIVELLLDSDAYNKSLKQASAQTTRFTKDLERVGRGSLAASVGFKGLGRSLAFASTSFVSGAGIVAGVKASVAAASDL